MAGRNSTEADVKARQFPGLVDNAHWNRMAGLIWALDEARRVGGKYARQVIANAKALAKALHEGGVPVKCEEQGFTASHQVFLAITDQREIDAFAQKLEDANIIVDHGMRLGTCEATRRGMKAQDLEEAAELVVRVYKGEDPAKIRKLATKLRREFNRIVFT